MQLTKDEPRVMTTSEVLALATETLIKGCKLEKHINMGYGVVACITFIVSAFAQFFWEKIVGKGS